MTWFTLLKRAWGNTRPTHMGKGRSANGYVADPAVQAAAARTRGWVPAWLRTRPRGNGGAPQKTVSTGSEANGRTGRTESAVPHWLRTGDQWNSARRRPTNGPVRPAHAGLSRDLLTEHSILPVGRHNGTLRLAVSAARCAAQARRLAVSVGCGAEIFVVEPDAIQKGLVDLFRAEDQQEVAWGHAERSPELSAQRVVTPGQKIAGALFLVILGAALFLSLLPTLITLVALGTAFYLASSGYKMFIVLKGATPGGEVEITQDEIDALDDAALPTYTILLPLFREANVVQRLLTGIEALDYPKDKLDVKLLLEADDAETLAVIDHANLPSHYQKMIVPSDGPKAKPRALNYGLLHARGKYCTIYDAEDRPEADQLKKAVIAFQQSPERVGCIQAKLNFYNRDQNLLTKWFTAEYSQWFDLYLPGLIAAGAVIPLGGTSNHFPTTVLREIGGWDPFNVTEDADLGIRLARSGWTTKMIDSVTYEEANSRLGNWLRQRSHWIKGYMQTWLVHMRHPLKLWHELGTHGFLSIQITVGGTVFGYFINPIFWGLLAAWYITVWGGIQTLYPAPLLYLGKIALFAGNFAFVYIAMAGCLKHEYYGGVKYALLMPLYWALMTVAAFHALYQLITKPHYWEKTMHGLAPESAAALSAEATR